MHCSSARVGREEEDSRMQRCCEPTPPTNQQQSWAVLLLGKVCFDRGLWCQVPGGFGVINFDFCPRPPPEIDAMVRKRSSSTQSQAKVAEVVSDSRQSVSRTVVTTEQ